MIALAPAKINLTLDVIRRRADGFHDLVTIFHVIDLADTIAIEPAGERHADDPLIIEFQIDGDPVCQPDTIPTDERNIVWKALARLDTGLHEPLPSLRVHLRKRIPHGAGLGGGSSDAAAALEIVNRLQDLGLTRKKLQQIAGETGSDCPFFLCGAQAALGEGRGEVLTPLQGAIRAEGLLVLPDFSIATAEAYRALNPDFLGETSNHKGLIDYIQNPDLEFPVPLENHFETALDPVYPDLPVIRSRLAESGAFLTRLSGSGSATFGLFENAPQRDQARSSFSDYLTIPFSMGLSK